MTDLQQALFDQFGRLKNDEERWAWMQKNSKKNSITVWLDNDGTFASFDDDTDDKTMDFFNYVGWTDGVRVLLNLLNIKNECV